MLDRPVPDATLSGSAESIQPRWPFAFVGLSGILGACGVAVGAAGAHVGGGDLARTSSEFLMVHAAVILAGAAMAAAAGRPSGCPRPAPAGLALLGLALGLLTLGAALFGGELAAAALIDWRPVPLAAPAGGLCLIGGWLCLCASGVAFAVRRR